MSQYRRNGGWVAKFDLGGTTHWVQGGPWATKTEARQAEQRLREQLSVPAGDQVETARSFAARWVVEWPREAAATRALYERAAKRFADEFADTPLDQIERLPARTWALTVPRNVYSIVATMYEDARNVGLIETNPFANLRLPKSETRDIAPPTLEEYRLLLHSCTLAGGYAAELRALITFAAWTGMRVGEIQGLKWSDVEEDEVQCRRARKNDGTLGLPKNRHARAVPFLPPARVLDQVPRRAGDDFVFHTAQGQPLTKSNGYYQWNKVKGPVNLQRQAEGLRPVRFHDLRHFCATQLLEMGRSHFDVSIQLGHRDGGRLVMERYGHPSEDAARNRLMAGFETAAIDIGEGVGS